ncbi:hypothetical protein EDB89DRAFT_2241864 [Lactarius sanguifluus]|nr:hypothetical protein EDB89DRAFT_2241864 [Lactarius sanguifluus]
MTKDGMGWRFRWGCVWEIVLWNARRVVGFDMMHEAYSSLGGGANMARWPILLRCTPKGRTNGVTKRTSGQRMRETAALRAGTRVLRVHMEQRGAGGQAGTTIRGDGPSIPAGAISRDSVRFLPIWPAEASQRCARPTAVPPSASIAHAISRSEPPLLLSDVTAGGRGVSSTLSPDRHTTKLLHIGDTLRRHAQGPDQSQPPPPPPPPPPPLTMLAGAQPLAPSISGIRPARASVETLSVAQSGLELLSLSPQARAETFPVERCQRGHPSPFFLLSRIMCGVRMDACVLCEPSE